MQQTRKKIAMMLAIMMMSSSCIPSTVAYAKNDDMPDTIDIQEVINNNIESHYDEIVVEQDGGVLVDGVQTKLSEALDISWAKSTYLKVTDSLDSYLHKNAYEITEKNDGTKIITNQYQSKSLILNELPEDLCGATAISTINGVTVLMYASEAETKAAHEYYSSLGYSVTIDTVFEADDWLKSVSYVDTFQTSASQLIGTSKCSENIVKNANNCADGELVNEVTVAVIDSGIDTSNAVFDNHSITAYSVFTDESELDTYGHGTHVAGIVASNTPSNVSILSIKAFTSTGQTSSLALIYGTAYAINNGADVINMSFGATDNSKTLDFLDSYINDAYDAGIPICVSAGNDSTNVATSYPANNSKTITVSAITGNNGVLSLASYSNYGTAIDFCAPGTYILSAKPKTMNIASSNYVDNSNVLPYSCYMSGTSMAAPYVTAQIANIVTYNKDYEVDEIYDILKNNSVDLGSTGKDTSFGWGYVDISDYNENIQTAASSHTYVSSIITPATCTESGLIQYTCSDVGCSESYTEVIPATGHNYASEWSIDKQAGLLTAGSKSRHCKNCDANIDVLSIPASDSTVNVSAKHTSTFSIQIPKTIVLNGNDSQVNSGSYTVSVLGDLTGTERIKVEPISNPDSVVMQGDALSADKTQFYMGQAGKVDIIATVMQDKTLWTWSDTNNSIAANGTVTAANMSAGTWLGHFNFAVSIDNAEIETSTPYAEYNTYTSK